MAATVSAAQRFTPHNPCPICGGHDRLPRGDGHRCWGFLGSDGRYTHCSRAEHAGGLPLEPDSGTYAHRLNGSGRCGQTHGEPEPEPATIRRNGSGRELGPVVADYLYPEADGRLWHRVTRHRDPKDFCPWHGGPAAWTKGEGGKKLPLYRLPELLAADPSAWVLIVEGEKDVDRLIELGFVATSNAGGAGKWRSEHSETLRGRRVCILPDNDAAGERDAKTKGQSLHGIAAELRVLRMPGLPDAGDVSDWLDADGTADDLARLIDDAPVWGPAAGAQEDETPIFPVWVFPEALKRFCEDAARMVQAPVDFVAVALLAFVAGIIGNTRQLELKPGNRVRAILWVCIVGPPGSAKTPALEAVRSLVSTLQDEAKARYDAAVKEYKDYEVAQESGTVTTKRTPKPSLPYLEHFYTTDATKEAIAGMAARSAGFTFYRDELMAWVASFDAYRGGRGGDRQDALSLWSGVALKIDRKHGEPIIAPAPTVSVCGGTQPDKLKTLRGDVGEDDGFFDRIQWSMLDSPPPAWSDEGIDPETSKAALALLAQLRQPVAHEGVITRGAEARTIWKCWYDENQKRAQTAPAGARGVYAKLPVQLARIALVLHALHDPRGERAELAGARLTDAIEVAEYFRAHAHRVLAHLGTAADPDPVGLAGRVWHLLHREARWVRTVAIHRLLSNNVRAAALHEALRELEVAGLIESREEPTETKPATAWRALPRQSTPHEQNEQNEESPKAAGATGNNSYGSYSSSHELDEWTGGEDGIL